MSKYPHTDLIDVPALHWHSVFTDLLGIESMDASHDDYNNGTIVTAFVECFKRADGKHHWQVFGMGQDRASFEDTIEAAQTAAETIFDRIRNS